MLTDHEIKAVEVWYFGRGFNTALSKNDPEVYQSFLNQTPDAALQQLGLTQGNQSDPQKTFDQFLNQNIYRLTFAGASVFTANPELPNYIKPTGKITELEVDQNKGTVTLKNIEVTMPWKDGKIGAESLKLPDITLQFRLLSSQLLANNPFDAITWLRQKYGAKPVAELLFD